MTPSLPIQFGLNYRDFPDSWRPALDEIAFAAAHGFAAIQFHGREQGLRDVELGAPAREVGVATRAAGLVPTMEIIVRVDRAGRAGDGATPLDVLRANLPAITALGCTRVHWHLVPRQDAADAEWLAFEQSLAPQFAAGVALGKAHGFHFGIEHNEPGIPLFPTPERCAAALDATPDLGLVWDLNHTAPEQRDTA